MYCNKVYEEWTYINLTTKSPNPNLLPKEKVLEQKKTGIDFLKTNSRYTIKERIYYSSINFSITSLLTPTLENPPS